MADVLCANRWVKEVWEGFPSIAAQIVREWDQTGLLSFSGEDSPLMARPMQHGQILSDRTESLVVTLLCFGGQQPSRFGLTIVLDYRHD